MPRTHSFEAKLQKNRSLFQKLADEVTRFAGSFAFLITNILFFITWLAINLNYIPQIPPFDSFPFPLLTTILSLEAILLAIFVLMSQNRQGQIDSLREEIHLQINEIAEKEITKSLKLLSEIHAKTVGKSEPDPELERMLKTLDTAQIESKLEKELEPQPLVISELLDQAEKKLGLKK